MTPWKQIFSAKLNLYKSNSPKKVGMKLARVIRRDNQNKEALMIHLILQKLILLTFALLISACSTRIANQGRVGYNPSMQSLPDKMEILHARYDKH